MSRVLVVDDSLSVRKMVERALESKGLEVIAASSGAEAMERLDSAMPDLIVCDVVMPDVDGYRICELVRGHPVLAGTPVLLISGIVNSAVRPYRISIKNGSKAMPLSLSNTRKNS